MSLHSQQTHVRRRLSQDSTSNISVSPTSHSVSSSPTRARRSSRAKSMSASPPSRRSSIESIPEHPEDEECTLTLSNDELKLHDISSRIKTTLTDLINCDGVRGDSRMRNWVAVRLMDVEHELKESKRRRHSVDATQARAISASLRE